MTGGAHRLQRSVQVVSSDNVRPEEIAAVGLSGQMHGAVLLNERDEVVASGVDMVRPT